MELKCAACSGKGLVRYEPYGSPDVCSECQGIYSDPAQILDACCGGRMWWWDKEHPLAVYMDSRELPPGTMEDHPNWSCQPDIKADFRDIPYPDDFFQLVLFDPPHMLRADAANKAHRVMPIKYGMLDSDSWKDDIAKGLSECWRVLAPGGTMVFKWAGKRGEVADFFPSTPIVGTRRQQETQWIIFYKALN